MSTLTVFLLLLACGALERIDQLEKEAKEKRDNADRHS